VNVPFGGIMDTLSEEFHELHKKGIISQVRKSYYFALFVVYFNISGRREITTKAHPLKNIASNFILPLIKILKFYWLKLKIHSTILCLLLPIPPFHVTWLLNR
jgi:hypothetical protein